MHVRFLFLAVIYGIWGPESGLFPFLNKNLCGDNAKIKKKCAFYLHFGNTLAGCHILSPT